MLSSKQAPETRQNNSAGECFPYKEEVTGSIPVSGTIGNHPSGQQDDKRRNVELTPELAATQTAENHGSIIVEILEVIKRVEGNHTCPGDEEHYIVYNWHKFMEVIDG